MNYSDFSKKTKVLGYSYLALLERAREYGLEGNSKRELQALDEAIELQAKFDDTVTEFMTFCIDEFGYDTDWTRLLSTL